MKNSLLKFSLLGLLAVAIAAPVSLRAQTTNKPPATEKKASKRTTVPFHGKLKAIDNTAKTISVGNETLQVTSQTTITKDGKPAELEDGVVGENVTGAYKKDAEGKLNAVSIHFGAKAKAAAASTTKTNTP
jgi:hypothetical protein